MECFKSVLEKLKGMRQEMGNLTSCKTCKTNTNDEDEHPPPAKKDPLLSHLTEDFLAMDFETGVGRIIQGEREIAEVKRAARHDPRLTAVLEDDPQIFKQGAHLTQKYYHKTLTRDSAYAVLGKHKKEGEWLLRDSESRKGTMSIDYFCAGRVRHVQIKVAQYTDPYTHGRVHVVTTDMDQAFYNVHSLIEFYRLNLGKNFRCILGQCLENPSQRDSSPPRLPLTIKVHTNTVAKYEQASGSGLLSKLGSKIRGKESPDKK